LFKKGVPFLARTYTHGRDGLMFGKLRKRVSYANVAMTFALVFAMTGGAWAANKFVITSTKQIKPSILKQLQGKTGPAGLAGKDGTAGPAGKDGLNGANGKDGLNGADGKEGAQGKEGKEGKQGLEGKEGSPWTAGGTLPSGKTETGAWTATVGAEGAAFGEAPFPIPLAAATVPATVVLSGTGTGGCEGGTGAKPTAKPGNFCAYVTEEPLGSVSVEGAVGAGTKVGGEASSTGAVILITGKPGFIVYGTYAVTAP
jgi:hypothetical protein